MIRKRFFYLLVFFNVTLTFFSTSAADIYVSLSGSDRNTGSKAQPFATLQSALRKARELRRLKDPSIKNGVQIIIEGGVYRLYEPISVRPEDSGTAESPTRIMAAPNAHVAFSGGAHVEGWKLLKNNLVGLPKVASGKVWVADAPHIGNELVLFRQMWVNGRKTVRARNQNGDKMDRILSWDFGSQTCRIPLNKKIDVEKIVGMEFVIQQWWAIANLRVKSAKRIGNAIELSFMQPESRIQSEHPWPAPWIAPTGNSAFYLSNAIEFLDEPGEWFEDVKARKIYYWPKADEQLKRSKVCVPVLETLVKMEGTIDRPINYVSFKGISFQHTTWLRPSQKGHVPLQAGMFLLDAYKLEIPGTPDKSGLENQAWVGRPPAAVEVSYAANTQILGCRFEHLASTGLDYKKGTSDSEIAGNLFKDIGGSAILIGTFSDEATEAHVPYMPSDLREISLRDRVENNLITNVTNEDWGTVGIGAGFVKAIKISHNEINEVSYTGISLGWGWTPTSNVMRENIISGNKIYRYGKHLYDVAGIYTLSAQPQSLITGNLVDSIYKAPYAHLPDHWFYIYTDEGSSGFSVIDNWTPSQKYLQNANGPNNVWQNNGNLVSDAIKANAGLQLGFKHLLKENTIPKRKPEINLADQSVILEVIFKEQRPKNLELVKDFCITNNIQNETIYQWQNRVVIYTVSKLPDTLRERLLTQIPGAEVKLYDNIFYEFNRKRNCVGEVAKEWDHVILSANLVNDERLQREYLNYHATQFDQWPELSKGFCNADFQQLVIYKNGRQLMLVISIPKGANLDELNPKTTLDNPRVDEWNNLMKKYQEGIPGTKKDEVWVFFKPIK